MTLNQLSRILFRANVVLRDLIAIRKGPKAMAKRYMRKLAWRKTGTWLNRL